MSGRQASEPSGLRERKKAATRSALRAAAVRLYRGARPEQVTVEDICAEVDVSPRTFFNYFATKDEAVFGLDADQAATIAGWIVDRPPEEDPLTAVQRVLEGIMDDGTGTGLWQDQMLLLREHPELVPRFHAATRATEQALGDGLARRTGRAPAAPYVRTTAAVAMTAMWVATARWLDSPEGSAAPPLLAETVELIRAGLTEPS